MLTIDGISFPNVKLGKFIRGVRIGNGGNGFVSFDGHIHQDQIGRYIDYTLSLKMSPYIPSEYDNLFAALSQTGEHIVSGLPYGRGEISGKYIFSDLTDEGTPDVPSGTRYWGNLQVSLIATEVFDGG